MKLLIVILLSTFSVFAHALIKKLDSEEYKELERYASTYTQLIQDQVYFGDKGNEGTIFKGKKCRIAIKIKELNDKEAVTDKVNVLSGDEELCKIAVLAVKKVAMFPLPKNQAVKESLLDIALTLAP